MLFGLEQRVARCSSGEDDIDAFANGNSPVGETKQHRDHLSSLNDFLEPKSDRCDVVDLGIVFGALLDCLQVFVEITGQTADEGNISDGLLHSLVPDQRVFRIHDHSVTWSQPSFIFCF
jgi:hypothetical protein